MNHRTWLTDFLGVHDATDAERDITASRLRAEYARTGSTTVARGRTEGHLVRRRWAVAAAVLAAVVVGFVFLPRTAPQADATLTELARATRTLQPSDRPTGAWSYYEIDQTALDVVEVDVEGTPARGSWLIRRVSKWWWLGDASVEERTTFEPRFLTPDAERVWDAIDGDVTEGVGQTQRFDEEGAASDIDLVDWATDSERLAEQISDFLAGGVDERSDAGRTLDLVAEILEPRRLPSPALRAAAIEIVSRLDVETSTVDDGGVAVSVVYPTQLGVVRESVTFDAHGFVVRWVLTYPDGNAEFGLDPGVPFLDLRQTPPAIAPEAGIEPAP